MNSIQACGYKSAYITSTVIASVMPFCIWTVWFVKYGFCCFYDIWWLASLEIAQHCFLSSVLSPVSNDDSRCHSIFKIGARNSQHVTHTTHDTIWRMKQVGFWNQMSYSCPMHTSCVIISQSVRVREIEPIVSNRRLVAEAKEEVIFSGSDKFRSCPPC